MKIISSVNHFCYLRFYKSLQAHAISVKCDLIKANIHLQRTFRRVYHQSVQQFYIKSKIQITNRKTPPTSKHINRLLFLFFTSCNQRTYRFIQRLKCCALFFFCPNAINSFCEGNKRFPEQTNEMCWNCRIDSLRTFARRHQVLMSSAINGQV